MFGLVHRYAPESARARTALALLSSLMAAVCLTFVFVTHGLIVQLLVGIGAIAVALAVTLGFGLMKQAEAAPDAANPAFEPETRTESDADPVETLQQRYAEGEVTDDEFERRMDRLLDSREQSEARSEREESSETVERATE